MHVLNLDNFAPIFPVCQHFPIHLTSSRLRSQLQIYAQTVITFIKLLHNCCCYVTR